MVMSYLVNNNHLEWDFHNHLNKSKYKEDAGNPSNTNKKFYTQQFDHYQWRTGLFERFPDKDAFLLAYDSGEPEDQTFCRDYEWIEPKLNELAADCEWMLAALNEAENPMGTSLEYQNKLQQLNQKYQAG